MTLTAKEINAAWPMPRAKKTDEEEWAAFAKALEPLLDAMTPEGIVEDFWRSG